jgi:hypothetical protein
MATPSALSTYRVLDAGWHLGSEHSPFGPRLKGTRVLAPLGALASMRSCCIKPAQKSRSALAEVRARGVARDYLATDGALKTDGMAAVRAHA